MTDPPPRGEGPPLRLLLDGAALVTNWRWVAARAGAAACGAAVKANGYGLGAREVVARLAAAGCRDFFVATWAEAEALGPLPAGVALSVLHGVRAADMAAARRSTARPVLNSPEQVARWKAAAGGACDVMIDTGINRLGLAPADAASGLLDGLAIETLHSHLACADEPGHAANERQLAMFRELAARIPARRRALANSAGVCLGSAYHLDLVRPGLGLYGGAPGPAAKDAMRPVARLEVELIQRRSVAAGAGVGYGATFVALEQMPVGILNIGYADGFLRAMGASNVARFGEAACPVVGRVSMDLIAVDLRLAGPAEEGDRLTIDLDLPAVSRATGLSQYELLTVLGSRFERIWC